VISSIYKTRISPCHMIQESQRTLKLTSEFLSQSLISHTFKISNYSRKWAQSPAHSPPPAFQEIQKRGRESSNGIVVVGTFSRSFSLLASKLPLNTSLHYISPSFSTTMTQYNSKLTTLAPKVACTDPRLTPTTFLDATSLSLPPPTIIRVTGGRVFAAMSSLLVLTAVGTEGSKGMIVVIHHTGFSSNFLS